MKIDIHTHTRRCKKGEAATREISPDRFCEVVSATDVKIIAITNHNLFDLAQYQDILERIPHGIQVWPGIELDIDDAGSRGHLLVIVSPSQAHAFDQRVRNLTSGLTPDEFSTSISQVLATFDELGPVYVAHYGHKKPDLSEEAVVALIEGTRWRDRVIREVTNSISAGIYIAHGYPSIYGSDVHDWAKYEEYARKLPELRLPVDSFEQFCLLLEKDATAIDTALDRKMPEELVLQPFEDGRFLKLTVYNDINIIFGAKGTGKSCILRAIADYYAANGIDARVFESASDRLNELFDLKGKDLQFDLASRGLPDCVAEINLLRSATEEDVTPLSAYYKHFSAKITNRNARRIRIKDLDTEPPGDARRAFDEASAATRTTAQFIEFLRTNNTVRDAVGAERIAAIEDLLSDLLARLREVTWNHFVAWREIELLNSAIQVFRREVARKTGSPAKPTSTGFRDYAANRCAIEKAARTIVEVLESQLSVEEEAIGSLGEDKGGLALRTEFKFHDGSVLDGSLTAFGKVKKSTQKNFARVVRSIRNAAYQENLFEHVAQLNGIEDVGSIRSVKDLLLFRRYFVLEGREYKPSSGEAAMVMLEKELRRDAEIYILDEPERSLGNEYISEVIVPLIRGHARAGKKVFIATHDANIAVRTLPYCSVYRAHGPKGYLTYVGNPFTNKLASVDDPTDCLDWRLVSMRTLEGGKEAFGERGRVYGHS